MLQIRRNKDEIAALSFGLIAVFLRHAADLLFIKEEAFNKLKTFLNGLDLSSLCQDEVSTGTHVAVTPVLKAKANRHLVLPLPAPFSGPVLQQEVDEDTSCFLPVTPPHSCPKLVKR